VILSPEGLNLALSASRANRIPGGENVGALAGVIPAAHVLPKRTAITTVTALHWSLWGGNCRSTLARAATRCAYRPDAVEGPDRAQPGYATSARRVSSKCLGFLATCEPPALLPTVLAPPNAPSLLGLVEVDAHDSLLTEGASEWGPQLSEVLSRAIRP